jgi:IS5 family transposase
MRKIIDFQQTFGNVDISQVKTDSKSRDEIDKVVRGLQYIYTNIEIRAEVFKKLESIIPAKTSKKTGRPGMDIWKIFVFGVIRQACSWDYDKLHHMANNELMIRELLGHDRGDWADKYYYELQTLKDNVSLLSPAIIDEISEIVVKSGHTLLGGKKKEELHASADSFVVETNTHFPSDISLLYDSIRKAITLTTNIFEEHNKSGWRQSAYRIISVKTEMRKVQQAKKAGSIKNEEKIKAAHRKYVTLATGLLEKVKSSLLEIEKAVYLDQRLLTSLMEIENFINHGEHQIDLIERRVFQGEKIPNCDKVHSIFEPHTRWISKGKIGVPVELGLPLTILKDQHGYILDYKTMETETDVEVAVPLMLRAKLKFPNIKSCSFDKGFWSPENRTKLREILDKLIMPKKGSLNKLEKAEESSKEFIKLRWQHSAVESAINGLDHCGLNKCYDHGKHGFKRCVALSILARNIFTLGKHVQEKEEKRKARKKHKKTA